MCGCTPENTEKPETNTLPVLNSQIATTNQAVTEMNNDNSTEGSTVTNSKEETSVTTSENVTIITDDDDMEIESEQTYVIGENSGFGGN